MSRQVVGRVLLALALVAGWQAALLHPIAHVDSSGELVHRHDGHSPDSGDLCDVLAALTACAPDAVQPTAVHALAENHLSVQNGDAPRAADAPPFLSQGPPASA